MRLRGKGGCVLSESCDGKNQVLRMWGEASGGDLIVAVTNLLIPDEVKCKIGLSHTA
jgi:hypothetical protein